MLRFDGIFAFNRQQRRPDSSAYGFGHAGLVLTPGGETMSMKEAKIRSYAGLALGIGAGTCTRLAQDFILEEGFRYYLGGVIPLRFGLACRQDLACIKARDVRLTIGLASAFAAPMCAVLSYLLLRPTAGIHTSSVVGLSTWFGYGATKWTFMRDPAAASPFDGRIQNPKARLKLSLGDPRNRRDVIGAGQAWWGLAAAALGVWLAINSGDLGLFGLANAGAFGRGLLGHQTCIFTILPCVVDASCLFASGLPVPVLPLPKEPTLFDHGPGARIMKQNMQRMA